MFFFNYRNDNLKNKQIKFSSSRYFCSGLRNLRNEIQMLSKNIHPKILKDLDSNSNPVKNNMQLIQNLVCLQQKLLSLTATTYGIYDIKTSSLANNYLCSLAFRIFAVFKTFGVDLMPTKRAKYCEWVKHLSYSNVFSQKVGLIKRVSIFKAKKSKCSLGTFNIFNKLTQMLFVLTYEPIVECVSDTYSFGFRKNRNAHQAIGVLFSKLHRYYEKKQFFYVPRHVLHYDVRKFFDTVNLD